VTGPVSCSAAGVCSFPATSCAAGWEDCDGDSSNGCETDVSRPTNCGGCGAACAPSTPVCNRAAGAGWACVTGCPNASLTLCDGSCVDTTGDANNCGSCGRACSGAPNAHPTCAGKTCGLECNAGFTKSCDGSSCVPLPDPASGVFAAPGGATGACGSQSAPCATLAAALAAAAAAGKSVVYLGPGTFAETVTLSADVTLRGGWTASWLPFCGGSPASAATIQGMEGGAAAVVVTAGSVALEAVTVQSKNSAGSGESLYGVFATAGAVALRGVIVNVAAGGSGQGGMTGSPGRAAVAPGTCVTAGTGVGGSTGTAGAGANAGGYSSSGYAPGNGGAAMPGGDGAAGPSAPAEGQPGGPTRVTISQDPCCQGYDVNGDPVGCVTCDATSVGTAGGVGCGGGGGGPGAGGTGGGASVGIFASNAQVTASGAFISTGAGGAGGQGGAGGAAASGAVGASGKDGDPLATSNCSTHPVTKICGGGHWRPGGLAGGGSRGGDGGNGGPGGGGSGGDSYCYVTVGSGSVDANGLSCTPGSPGLGGLDGDRTQARQGASGHSGVHN
jgi:hypothetical protein